MSQPGLRHRRGSSKAVNRKASHNAIEEPTGGTKLELSEPLLSDETTDAPFAPKEMRHDASYQHSATRSHQLDGVHHTHTDSSGSSKSSGFSFAKFSTAAYSAACTVLDVMPNKLSLTLFAPELTAAECNSLHNYESVRLVPFDREDAKHRQSLVFLWENCHAAKPLHSVANSNGPEQMPREGAERGKEFVSAEWKEFGFQGLDPATDFRGGGVFSLYNLVAVSGSYPRMWGRMLQDADYPVAVAGINISMMVLHILGLTKGKVTCLATTQLKHNYTAQTAKVKLARIVLNTARAAARAGESDLNTEIERVLHDVYAVALAMCHTEWMSRKAPRNLMEFNSTFPAVRAKMEVVLRSSDTLDDLLKASPMPLE